MVTLQVRTLQTFHLFLLNSNDRVRMRSVVPIFACVALVIAGIGVSCGAETIRYRTGVGFQVELKKPISGSWSFVEYRGVLERISTSRQVAILLDRRIDPSQELNIDIDEPSLSAALENIGKRSGAGLSLLKSLAYLGPPRSAAILRTLIELRLDELFSISKELPKGRHFKLAERRLVTWDDLTEPAEVLQLIAKRYQLKIEGLDQIPYDQWAGGNLPMVNSLEAFSLVLIQFDLTFEWLEKAAGIRIVPLPRNVGVVKEYSPRNMTAQTALKKLGAEFAGLNAEIRGRKVRVFATVERHEAVNSLLRPGFKSTKKPQPTAGKAPVPLSRRRFDKLKVDRVPVLALMQKLQQSQIQFEFDAEKMKKAGIDFNQRITLDLKAATAEEVFRAMFDPIGVSFQIEGVTVTLGPK